ncbi:MAG: MFS transporter [SAR202 cluster bacterium]|nr:MFS transporter [SAR202 cluster bacterium]
MRVPAALKLLADRNFRTYFIADAFHDLGVDSRLVGMGWLALELTNSQLWVGLVTGVGGFTMVVFSPIGGIVVDRSNRRNLLIWVRLALMVSFLAAAVLVIADVVEPWHLLLVGLSIGAIRAVSGTALRAFLVDLVGTERVLTANALVQASFSAGDLLGPAIVGLLIVSAGVGSVFLMAASALALSALMMLRVNPRLSVARGSDQSVFRDLGDGWSYIRRTPPIPALLLVTMTQFPGGVIIPLMPVYARDVLDVGPVGLGVMGGALGAGFLVGSLAASSRGGVTHKGLALVWTAMLWDAAMVSFGFSRVFPLSVALLFVMGFGGALHAVFLITLFQTIASDEMRGRVMSVHELIAAAFPLGFLLGGALAQAFGNEVALILGMLAAPRCWR